MSERDIFGKADALLRRHAAAADPGAETGGVPILTDLVEPPPPPRQVPFTPADEAAAIAREVFTRVMAEVEGRLAAELERRLAEHLVTQVHAAVGSALGDMRQELANTIGDAVAQALAERPVK